MRITVDIPDEFHESAKRLLDASRPKRKWVVTLTEATPRFRLGELNSHYVREQFPIDPVHLMYVAARTEQGAIDAALHNVVGSMKWASVTARIALPADLGCVEVFA